MALLVITFTDRMIAKGVEFGPIRIVHDQLLRSILYSDRGAEDFLN